MTGKLNWLGRSKSRPSRLSRAALLGCRGEAGVSPPRKLLIRSNKILGWRTHD